MSLAAGSHSASLDKDVQVDLLMAKITTLLKSSKEAEALPYFAELEALGTSLPESFYFYYIDTLDKAGDAANALRRSEAYVNRYGRKGRYYNNVIAIMSRLSLQADKGPKMTTPKVERKPAREQAVEPERTAKTDYPNRPLRLVVPFFPEDSADIAARGVAQRMAESFGKPVVTENSPGAGTTLGTDAVAKAAPDGYTLLLTNNTIAINETLYPGRRYEAQRDFTQVILVGSIANVLVVNPQVPAKTTQELIALARSKPRALNYGNSGVGGTPHLAMEYFKLSTATDLVHAPYKETALVDLSRGHVQVMISPLPRAFASIQGKRIVALAMTGARRSAFLPDVSTLAESGLPGYALDTWFGVHAPAKTPNDIIVKVNATIAEALNTPSVKEQLFKVWIEREPSTPEAFRRFMISEIEKMAKIIKAAGIKPEG